MGQIQRIQSVYLFFAAILAVAFFMFPFASAEIQSTGFFDDGIFNYLDHLVLTILSIAVLLLCVLPIFLYNNRNLQMSLIKINLLSLLLLLILLIYFFLAISHKYYFGVSFFVPMVVIIFLFLAYRAIGQDEKLVRDSDRLR